MRRLVIALLVLVGVLVVADFGAAALAESAVSRQMRTQLALADDPSVRINGFPFLTQAVAGKCGSVESPRSASPSASGELGVRTQLRDVEAPLPMLLGSGEKTLQVRAAEGTVRIRPTTCSGCCREREAAPGDDRRGRAEQASHGADGSIGDIDPDEAVRWSASEPCSDRTSRSR